MKIGLVLAPLFIASVAHAQAPGDYYEVAPPGMAPVEPVYVPPPPPPKPKRWSIGLGLGSLDLAPHKSPDAGTSFDVAQLALRYRATRRLELELALQGGGEFDEHGEGDREVGSAVLALRYRFNPERRWNFWVMAGMGSLAVTSKHASDEERESAEQSTLQFGGGVERRWRRFALQFELRAVGVKPNDEGDVMVAYPEDKPTEPGGMPVPPTEPTYNTRDGWAGGQFTFSGNWYF